MKYTIKQWLKGQTIYIRGMICASCEELIENKIGQLGGIKNITASYSHNRVKVIYNPEMTGMKQIREAVEQLSYKVTAGSGSTAVNPKETVGNKGLGLGTLIVIGLIIYMLSRFIPEIPLLNAIPEINPNMGLGVLFVVGLLTSLHCMAMCGGINLSQCVPGDCDSNSKHKSQLRPSLLYNTGRVLSYTVIGGIVGAIGSVIDFPGSAKGIVAIAAGLLMIIIGLNILNLFPGLKKYTPKLPKRMYSLFKGKGQKGPFYVGLLNGFMPCGPLQAMQIYALGTGSAVAGATSMFFFSIGTVPLMFGLGAVSSMLNSRFTKKILQVSAVLVIILGVVMLNRGLSLSGISVTSIMPAGNVSQQTSNAEKAIINGDVQTVTTTLKSGGYTSIIVRAGIPVKWTIEADSKNLNGCNNALQIPAYGIKQGLYPGENIIEFIPQNAGNVPFSCWMGMIRSNITVMEQ